MGKILDSIGASLNAAIDWFVTLPWWLQLLVALACCTFVINLLLSIYGRIANGGHQPGYD